MNSFNEAPTRVAFEMHARKEMLKGIEIIANAVGSTLGPEGQCVIIDRKEGPYVTKDGVTVSKAINLKNRLMALGANLLKEAAGQTNELAGDGTTTSTVMAHAMCVEGMRLLAAHHSPVELVEGIKQGVEFVVNVIKEYSNPVTSDDLVHVATISANGEKEIGRLIAEAIEAAGKDGIVSVEASKSADTTLDVVQGVRIDRGYVSPYFVNDKERMRCVLDDAYVLITNDTITSLTDFIPVLDAIHRQGKSILIIAPSVEGEALQLLAVNKMQNNLNACAVVAPGYDFGIQRTEALLDLCALTGAELCTEALGGLRSLKIEDLGRIHRSVITQHDCTLIGDTEDNIDMVERANMIRNELNDVNINDDIAKMLHTRLTHLAGTAVVIHVGGATDIALRERRDRIDDSLCSVRAAVEEGVIPGGGTILAKISVNLKNKSIGEQLVRRACEAPLRRIAYNASLTPELVLEKVINAESHIGFDARTKQYVSMIDAEILDSTKVVRIALEKAGSVASTFLTLNAAVIPDED